MFAYSLPTLLGLALVFGFYARNIYEITLIDMIIPAVLTACITGCLTLITTKVLHNRTKAILVSIAYTIALFGTSSLNQLWALNYGTAEMVCTIVVTAILAGILRINMPKAVISVLAAITLGMFVIPTYLVVANFGAIAWASQPANTSSTVITPATLDAPNIIYIVPDRYASNPTLVKYFQYDNSLFTDALVQRGFYVNTSARANFSSSIMSIGTVLNLGYPETLYGNKQAVINSLQSPVLGKLLINQGYTYYHFGSWWPPTRDSKLTQIYHSAQVTRIPSVTTEYVKRSFLAPLLNAVEDANYPGRERVATITEKQLDLLAASKMSQPNLVFAHLLSPHPPIKFGSDGGIPNDTLSIAQQYVEEIKYLNLRLLQCIDSMLETQPNTIIILMADEGVKPLQEDSLCGALDGSFTTAELDEMTLGILMAVYYPDKNYTALYDAITPVNVMRVTLNQYLNTGFPLLPDLHYRMANIADNPRSVE